MTNVNVASLEDIAAMKIAAIADRGTKRDFIDLYFLAKLFPLVKIIDFYDQKFKNLANAKTHILKGLVYFTDAESEPTPRMVQSVNWSEVKKFFEEEVKKISQKQLGT